MNALGSLVGRLAPEGVRYTREIAGEAVAAQETGGPGANGGRNEVGDYHQLGGASPQLDQLAMQQPQTQGRQPLHAPRGHHHSHTWRAVEGLDATGHGSRQAVSYDTYVNGGDKS